MMFLFVFVFLFFCFFFGGGGGLMRGEREERIQIALKAMHNRSASETPFLMAFRWPANDGSTFAGLVVL